MWGSGDNCGIHTELFWAGSLQGVIKSYQFWSIVTTRSSNVKDDAAFRCCMTRHPLDSTLVTLGKTISDVGWEVSSMCTDRNVGDTRSFFFSKASSLNKWREAYHLPLRLDSIEILTMQAPVLECGESEDDEVDNDPPLTASRSDSGMVSSRDTATCGNTAYWCLNKDFEFRHPYHLNFDEYL